MSTLNIHPSAVVDARAQVGDGVTIGAHAVIEADVTVGTGAHVQAGTVLMRGTRVGAGASLGPYAVIGGAPMDTRYRGEPTWVEIGERAELREFVTVHRATGEGECTRIGAGALIMTGAHVTHNCNVGERATLVTYVQLGGHVEIGADAVIGAGSMFHQWTRVGEGAMVGAASAFNRDVLPLCMARGNPGVHYRSNAVGLRRRGVSSDRLGLIEKALRLVRQRDLTGLASLANESEDAALIHRFIQEARRGISGFAGQG